VIAGTVAGMPPTARRAVPDHRITDFRDLLGVAGL
jgi:hypothetical protein